MTDRLRPSRTVLYGCALLGILIAPGASLAQSYQVYTDRQQFLDAAAQVAEKIESDDFSDYAEGEIDTGTLAEHPAAVLDHLRIAVLDGLDFSINYPGSPGRDTRIFFDDVTTMNEYPLAIRFDPEAESPSRSRHVLRPVEIDEQGYPVSPSGSINTGNIRFRLVSDRVRGFGLDLEGVHIPDASVLLVRFFDSGTDLYLDIPAGTDGTLFFGIVADQPFDAVQLWAGRPSLHESVQIASVVTAFTDPPVELGCPGDTNWDGVVDLNDLNALLINFGDDSGVLGVEGGDVNGDHLVNLDDLNYLLVHFGLNGCAGDPDDGGGEGDGGGDGGDGDGGQPDGGDGGDGGGGDDDDEGDGGDGGDDDPTNPGDGGGGGSEFEPEG